MSLFGKTMMGTLAVSAVAFSAVPAMAHPYHRTAYGIDQRAAVDRCVRAVEYRASRFGRADVTAIRDVDRTRYGYRVKGKLAVVNGYRYNRDVDRGNFTCVIDGRGAPLIDIDNIGRRRW